MISDNLRRKIEIAKKYLPISELTTYESIKKKELEITASITLLYGILNQTGQPKKLLKTLLRNILKALKEMNEVNRKQKIQVMNGY